MMITPDLKEEKKLTRSIGAWINAGDNGGPAVIADSPAAKAGLEEGDIVFEINGVKLNDTNNLFTFVQRFKPGQKIGLKIDRAGKILVKIVLLDEFK
jgi:S1-C subfamily serine protease